MRKLPILMLLCLSLLGCTHYAPRTPRPLAIYNASVNTELSSGTWLSTYDASPSIAARNHLIDEFIWSVDRNYDVFEIQFYSGKATGDIIGDFLGLGLGGAAVLANAQHTKTILALAASTVVGAKASLDARWYDASSREAIVSQMRALRAEQLVELNQGLASPLSAYSLDQGIIDVQAYYQAGSVVEALQQISQTASAQATAAKLTLKQMRKPAPLLP